MERQSRRHAADSRAAGRRDSAASPARFDEYFTKSAVAAHEFESRSCNAQRGLLPYTGRNQWAKTCHRPSNAAPAAQPLRRAGPRDLFAAIADPDVGRRPRQRCRRSPTRSAAPAVPAPSRTSPPASPISPSSWCTTSTSRPATRCPARNLLDLGLIYGDGPKHDAFCYQVPAEAGAGRHLLRIGRARPTPTSPAWGAARDLPRTSCPNLDTRPVETRTEVLVPNTFSDSNLLLGQVQVLWALMHNAIAATLVETRCRRRGLRPGQPDQPRHLSRRDPPRRARQLADAAVPRPLRRADAAPAVVGRARSARPAEFMAGVGRLGHGLVREIYSLNDQLQVAGLRNLVRQTSTGRPHDMPLTEDWLVDFSRFFAIGSSVPQRARALGPHVARPFATGLGVGTDGSADGLVLRDLIACTRGGLRSVRSLIFRAARAEPRLFEGCFAQDETNWTAARGRLAGRHRPRARRDRPAGRRPAADALPDARGGGGHAAAGRSARSAR